VPPEQRIVQPMHGLRELGEAVVWPVDQEGHKQERLFVKIIRERLFPTVIVPLQNRQHRRVVLLLVVEVTRCVMKTNVDVIKKE